MNSYLLTKFFYQQLEESEPMQYKCTPHHQALFFRIVQLQNQVGWAVKSFHLPTESTMFYTCIGSYKTYRKCIAELVAWNIIAIIEEPKNQYQSRKITLHTEKWTAFSTQAGAEQLPKQVQHTAEADTNTSARQSQSTDQSRAQADPVNKTTKLVKEKTTKPLNLKTCKEVDYEKSVLDKNIHSTEFNFSTQAIAHDAVVGKSPPAKEKKKVAPKRKGLAREESQSVCPPGQNGAKPEEIQLDNKQTSDFRNNPKAKPDLLFKDSLYADKEKFRAAFTGTAYAGANLDYYYEILKNWSESKQATKKDWIATVKNWMLKDFREGKLVTKDSTHYVNSQSADASNSSSYAELGEAIDQYFERKYGK